MELGYVSWQEILNQLSQIEVDAPYQKLILNDLVSLLKRKGFERFSGFTIDNIPEIAQSDYYRYDYEQQNTNADVCFEYPETVIGGSYYEYR